MRKRFTRNLWVFFLFLWWWWSLAYAIAIAFNSACKLYPKFSKKYSPFEIPYHLRQPLTLPYGCRFCVSRIIYNAVVFGVRASCRWLVFIRNIWFGSPERISHTYSDWMRVYCTHAFIEPLNTYEIQHITVRIPYSMQRIYFVHFFSGN